MAGKTRAGTIVGNHQRPAGCVVRTPISEHARSDHIRESCWAPSLLSKMAAHGMHTGVGGLFFCTDQESGLTSSIKAYSRFIFTTEVVVKGENPQEDNQLKI